MIQKTETKLIPGISDTGLNCSLHSRWHASDLIQYHVLINIFPTFQIFTNEWNSAKVPWSCFRACFLLTFGWISWNEITQTGALNAIKYLWKHWESRGSEGGFLRTESLDSFEIFIRVSPPGGRITAIVMLDLKYQ